MGPVLTLPQYIVVVTEPVGPVGKERKAVGNRERSVPVIHGFSPSLPKGDFHKSTGGLSEYGLPDCREAGPPAQVSVQTSHYILCSESGFMMIDYPHNSGRSPTA